MTALPSVVVRWRSPVGLPITPHPALSTPPPLALVLPVAPVLSVPLAPPVAAPVVTPGPLCGGCDPPEPQAPDAVPVARGDPLHAPWSAESATSPNDERDRDTGLAFERFIRREYGAPR